MRILIIASFAVGILLHVPRASAKGALTADKVRALKPSDSFKECRACPEMVVVPAGSFTMGSPENEAGREEKESPQHQVTFARPFAVGKFSVTFEEWDACVADRGCNRYRPSDAGWGRGRRPVINVAWDDAKSYVAWISRKTGKTYRLLTEAEREYVTRAGTTTMYWWGSTISPQQANYATGKIQNLGVKSEYGGKTAPVDAFKPNPWGLYQVHGNVWEWAEDCFRGNYDDAPTDGSVMIGGNCERRVVRGGAWYGGTYGGPGELRSAHRNWFTPSSRFEYLGFRVARTLEP